MARVVVTGGFGFLGGHLADALVRQGDDVLVYDSGEPAPDQAEVRRLRGDVRDRDRLAEAITEGVDVVYHLAAVVGVDRYLDRPLDVIDINFEGTRNVLELAARAGARVLAASTSEIFGKNPEVPWAEDADRLLGSTATDRWSYSSSKALAEHLVFAYARQHRLPATIVRYFNVYGPRQRPAFVISRTLHRALRGLPPVRYDDGLQTRCFTYVDDAVAATLLAARSERAIGECFNVGSTAETTVKEAIDLVTEVAGPSGPAAVSVDTGARLGARYQDLPRRVPDTRKAAGVLGWHCATGLRDGLARTVAWARANPWWLAQDDSGTS
ncbi:NAD-dependent epimerase/dehydratase family protein [Nonomuraea sp. NN258]|uniref:NAD-dependent epimerase/dehydratase family protein n=1 Tax=Nonomuraea antri TaxID=2730852 RepID=UPI00156A29D5|nr:NAD-dependent epimerase/dehydratase family protein [Nonomuraea antri]NRQ31684.1 NAD-dependent epimerase/dehydratase family protein [Nonomuraea antri]